MPRRQFFIIVAIWLTAFGIAYFFFRYAGDASYKSALESAKKVNDQSAEELKKAVQRVESLPTNAAVFDQTVQAMDAVVKSAAANPQISGSQSYVALTAQVDRLSKLLKTAPVEDQTHRQQFLATLTAFQRQTDLTGRELDRLIGTADTSADKAVAAAKEVVAFLSLPLLLFFVIMYFFIFPVSLQQVTAALESFSSIKFAGAELIMTDKVRRNAKEAVQQFRSQVTETFTTLADEHRVAKCLEDALTSPAVKALFGNRAITTVEGFRATIHVQDMLFSQTLCQLIDYFPDQADRPSSPRGSTKSIRYGIIGKAWRLGEPQAEFVAANPEALMTEWGMTKDEAQRAASNEGPKSMRATLLMNSQTNRPVAVLYMDAAPKDAFGNERHFHATMVNACKEAGLIAALVSVAEKAKSSAPLIPIN